MFTQTSEMEELAGGWRRLHSEELHNLYASSHNISNQVKEDEMGGACSTHEKDEKCVQNFGQKNVI